MPTVDEVVINEGFEQAIPDFHTYQARYSADTARAHSGTHSLRVTPTQSSGGAYFRLDGEVDLKSDYEFSAWVYAEKADAVRLYVSASDGQRRHTKGQVSGGQAGQWVQLVGTLRGKDWNATDKQVMLALSCSGEAWFDDVVLRKTRLPEPPISIYPQLVKSLHAAADQSVVRFSPGTTLTLQAHDGSLLDGFQSTSPSRPEGVQAVISPDGMLTFALDLAEPAYVTGTMQLAPDEDLRPGLRAYVLSDDAVVAAPMVAADAWEGEGKPLTGPAPKIAGTRPKDEVELATWLLPAGRHYLTVAGPHFRPAGTFRQLTLRSLPRSVEEPLYRFALLSDTHLGTGRAVWMNTKLDGPANEELGETLVALKREGINWAIIAGDMTNSGIRSQFQSLGNVCRDSGLPVYGCIGNHDAFLVSSRGDALELCPELFPGGKTGYVFHKAPLRFIVLDGAHWKSKKGEFLDHYDRSDFGGIGPTPEQTQWLKQELARDTKSPTIVVWHFPMYGRGGVSSCGYKLPDISVGATTLEALRESRNVVAVLCGHTHWNECNVRDGITHLVNPGFIEWPNAYRVFRVYKNRLEWELRQVPNRGFVRESFVVPKALAWMISTGEGDLTGKVSF
jgi:predicted phosphodiesterase